MICDARRSLILKPSNVQSQWAAIQFLTGSLQNAAENTYSGQGQSHQWSSYYANLVTTFNEKYVSLFTHSMIYILVSISENVKNV